MNHMLLQIMNTDSFFRFTDVLVNGGIENARVLVDMARAIGGIATFFYISKRIYEQLIADNPISMLPLLRPFALVLVITFWGPFVNLLMVPTKGLTKLSEAVYADKKHIVAQRLQEKQKAIIAIDLPSFYENQEKEATLWDKGINILLTTYNIVSGRALANQIEFYLMDGIRQLLESLFEAVVYLIAFLRTIFCVLLIIFGPLVFAISIFDGFQDNYLQWIARFVNVNLYLPIAMLILALVQEVLIYVLDSEIAVINSSLIYQPADYYVSNLVVPVCGIAGLLMVPKIASWIVQASGTGSGGGRLLKTAATIAVTKGMMK
jgi:conjugative transposon TraJ protein